MDSCTIVCLCVVLVVKRTQCALCRNSYEVVGAWTWPVWSDNSRRDYYCVHFKINFSGGQKGSTAFSVICDRRASEVTT